LLTQKQKIQTRVLQKLDREAQRLDQLSLRLSHAIPDPKQMREKYLQLMNRWNQSILVRLDSYKQAHKSRQIHLEVLNPQRTLERGYAVLMDESGKALRNPKDIAVSSSFELHLAQGNAEVYFSEVLPKN
jgi:exodeoxyribonuclease VII large subunit